ncbi:MAG: hypothetical protein IPM22_08440 [Betaproteobacteria bacterium]|nr:hypothetical protein [Betaproteobacteria bacterium]
MKKSFLAAALVLVIGPAAAEVPLFAARCGAGITADSNAKGQVYVNGKVAKLVNRPDGQVTAQFAGVYVDITPRGSEPPRITYTAKDKSFGECEILSFRAPGGGAATSTAGGGSSGGSASGAGGSQRASSSERAGQGQFDARGPVSCAMRAGQKMEQCEANVAREPGGTATVVVTRPDGRTRFIFFEKGKAIGADLSQADGSQRFRASRRGDVYRIEAGSERYEIVEAMVFGG